MCAEGVGARNLDETERDFGDWYCFNGGSSDPEEIIETIEANLGPVEPGEPIPVLEAIEERLVE